MRSPKTAFSIFHLVFTISSISTPYVRPPIPYEAFCLPLDFSCCEFVVPAFNTRRKKTFELRRCFCPKFREIRLSDK